jgi:phosphoribosylcarboxyaminoimidazole (NCAIR) mutase
MGSISDMPVMQDAIDILKGFDIETEVDIVSAHRTPENYSISAKTPTPEAFRSSLQAQVARHTYPEWSPP